MKILVVEDEIKLADYLAKGLAEEGFVVDVAHNGVDGLHLASELDYDLIVLDGMLPGIDGLAVLAALRQTKQTPVLMLTARGQVEDRVRGLQEGADDYLVKPFRFQSWWRDCMCYCDAVTVPAVPVHHKQPQRRQHCGWKTWSWT